MPTIDTASITSTVENTDPNDNRTSDEEPAQPSPQPNTEYVDLLQDPEPPQSNVIVTKEFIKNKMKEQLDQLQGILFDQMTTFQTCTIDLIINTTKDEVKKEMHDFTRITSR